MAAADRALKVTQKDGVDWVGPYGVKANAIIFHGTMVGLNTTGNQLVPASTTIACIGMADLQCWKDQSATGQATIFGETTGQKLDNTGGADGARRVAVRQGAFLFGNKAGDLVTRAHMGQLVYVEDDKTVRATAAGSVVAGKLVGWNDPVTETGPMISMGTDDLHYGRA